MHTERQLAYMAGIVDGEGYVALAGKRRDRNYYGYPLISIASTSDDLIAWITTHFPTSIKIYDRAVTAHTKASRMVRWLGKPAVALLMELQPYLIVKTKQAALVIASAEINQLGKSRRGSRVPEWLIHRRIQIQQHLDMLNGRGNDLYLVPSLS